MRAEQQWSSCRTEHQVRRATGRERVLEGGARADPDQLMMPFSTLRMKSGVGRHSNSGVREIFYGNYSVMMERIHKGEQVDKVKPCTGVTRFRTLVRFGKIAMILRIIRYRGAEREGGGGTGRKREKRGRGERAEEGGVRGGKGEREAGGRHALSSEVEQRHDPVPKQPLRDPALTRGDVEPWALLCGCGWPQDGNATCCVHDRQWPYAVLSAARVPQSYQLSDDPRAENQTDALEMSVHVGAAGKITQKLKHVDNERNVQLNQ